MDDLQAGARLAGLSPLPQRAAGDAGRARFGIPPPLVDPLEAAFEDDLAGWLARLYAVRDERRLMGRLERTYGVGWLAVTAATLAMLLFGAIAALAAAVLLVAALVVAWQAAMSRKPARPERRPLAGAPGSSAKVSDWAGVSASVAVAENVREWPGATIRFGMAASAGGWLFWFGVRLLSGMTCLDSPGGAHISTAVAASALSKYSSVSS